MDLPKSGFAGMKQNFVKDLYAGFLVSLIALPLSLGLALASGAPAFAGIVTAVIGGVVVSIFGGSYVTISGVGNGLAVATLAAVTALNTSGQEDGYMYVLAAVIVSGALITLLGIFRFGSISDYFPSAAVEGMLAAIGLLIMAKQLHIMIGIVPPKGLSAIELYGLIPDSIYTIIKSEDFAVTVLGLLSLLIMIFYSKIRNKTFHIIPAPMWVVIISVALSFFLEHQNLFHLVPKKFLISLPDDIIGSYVAPNFSKINSIDFWNAVITLTLIASIESLLSIKGVERLDVFRRRVNTNKDLRAHGIATTISGFLGGLNVVAVIARSSVNVNSGAVTRASNFYQGLVIALAVFFFDDIISRIPMPALSAILVYTGFKLASPKSIIRVAKIGWESLTTYLVTLIVTMVFGLIQGIVSGILCALILQLITTQRASLILRNIFRPNTLLYQEDNGQYILSVKNYSNFLNYNRLRLKLDSIPSGSNVILDFTLCQFVDETILEHLANYNELYERKGGSIEIIGMDDLQTNSSHPFSPWVPLIGNKPSGKVVLTKRQKSIRTCMHEIGWEFVPHPKDEKYDLKGFSYFKTHEVDAVRNKAEGRVNKQKLEFLDLEFHKGEFIAKESLRASILVIRGFKSMPSFILDRENLFDKIASVAGFKDINFPEHSDFSSRFHLTGKNEELVKNFFAKDLILFFEQNPPFHIESHKGNLMVFEKERLSSLSEIKLMVSFAIRLTEIIQRIQKEKADARIEITN